MIPAMFTSNYQSPAITVPKVYVPPLQIDVNIVQSKQLGTETTSSSSGIRPMLSLRLQLIEQMNQFHAHKNYVLLRTKRCALLSTSHASPTGLHVVRTGYSSYSPRKSSPCSLECKDGETYRTANFGHYANDLATFRFS